MGKIFKTVALICGAVFIFFVGRFFYMIACISCTYPPIKTYVYDGYYYQLNTGLEAFNHAHNNVTFKFSRRDSSIVPDNGSRDLEINWKQDTTMKKYSFVCDQTGKMIEIKMVGALKNDSIGGYTDDTPVVKALLTDFEKDILRPMRKEVNIAFRSE